ncbi:MAG: acyltransferase family protein [Candidatus Pelagibacter sp.]
MYKRNQIYYIQYLRALSVLLVFFYHLKFEIFQNGYLGVDIFFVISGYVITSRLYEDFKINKTISLKNFFIKRFKRIYPILLVFLFTTFIIITILSPLENFNNRINTLLFALLGISNFFYLFSDKGYFDTIFDDPLNHTWSLGVEEQFYIFFPISFLILIYFFRNNFKFISYFFITLILLGIIFTFSNQDDVKLTFYSPLFRFWQFLFGSVIFLISLYSDYKNKYLSYFFILGVFLISLSGNFLIIFKKFY